MKRTERQELNRLIRGAKQMFENRPEINRLKTQGHKDFVKVYPMDVHWGIEIRVGNSIDEKDLFTIEILREQYGLKEVCIYAGWADDEGDVIIQLMRPYDHGIEKKD